MAREQALSTGAPGRWRSHHPTWRDAAMYDADCLNGQADD